MATEQTTATSLREQLDMALVALKAWKTRADGAASLYETAVKERDEAQAALRLSTIENVALHDAAARVLRDPLLVGRKSVEALAVVLAGQLGTRDLDAEQERDRAQSALTALVIALDPEEPGEVCRVCGCADPHFDEPHVADCAYMLARRLAGRGTAVEAGPALVDDPGERWGGEEG